VRGSLKFFDRISRDFGKDSVGQLNKSSGVGDRKEEFIGTDIDRYFSSIDMFSQMNLRASPKDRFFHGKSLVL
jgi:hypothetical protein